MKPNTQHNENLDANKPSADTPVDREQRRVWEVVDNIVDGTGNFVGGTVEVGSTAVGHLMSATGTAIGGVLGGVERFAKNGFKSYLKNRRSRSSKNNSTSA